MGEASNPSYIDRIRSFARNQASDRSSSAHDSPNPPLNHPSTSSEHADTSHHSQQNSQPAGKPITEKDVVGQAPAASALPAALHDAQGDGDRNTTLVAGEKPKLSVRMKNGSMRFVRHTKNALTHSWINVLLIFVPIGIAVNWVNMPHDIKPTVIFALNAVAIIPLAGLLSHATESVASRMGDTIGSLLNVTFGNAVELIIFIIALTKNEIRIVQASILGSILANLLLILGMAFLLGGLRYQEQIYNSTVTQMSACLLSLAVMSLLLPTAFHACFSSTELADYTTTKISRGTSVVLLLVYILYLLFQLKSHAYMYESTPQQVIDEESHPGVFADMLNSSTSDSSTTSGDSDSDSSSGSGSYTTAKKRFKRAFRNRMRRKSNASSFQTGSMPSALSSPSFERASVSEDANTPPQDSYFESNNGQRRGTRKADGPGTRVPSNALMSGDEADTDGENDRNAPRVRDFEAEHAGSVKSSQKHTEGKHKKKGRKKHWKHKHDEKHSKSTVVDDTAQPGAAPRVGFAEEPVSTYIEPRPASPKRPFAKRQLSRVVRPPLPNVFTNTVFSQPQTPHPVNFQAGPLSAARAATTGIRRANSLPDRLNNQGQTQRTKRLPYSIPGAVRTPDTMVMNEADAIHKDKLDEKPMPMSRTAAVMLLLISTGLVAFCAELLVDSIPEMIANTNVSQAFIGLIILPIVGNTAEHVTAVTVATKNKMDLAIGVAVGSSIQIALFVTPFVVLLGWILGKEMSLYFNLFETVSLFVTAFVVNFLVLDGRSNYLEGSLLIAAYVIIAVAAFFYPAEAQQSDIGGGASGGG